jgi:hypothetical protein
MPVTVASENFYLRSLNESEVKTPSPDLFAPLAAPETQESLLVTGRLDWSKCDLGAITRRFS